MPMRDISLNKRVEDVRSQFETLRVVHFDLYEIKSRFDESIKDVEKKFELYDELLSSGKQEEADDILRTQIVFIEGVLDFYMHEISKYCYYNMFSGDWEKTSQYKNFKVNMETVEKALDSESSKEWFFEYVNDVFKRIVFLSAESINDQLNAIGIPFNEVMHEVFKEGTSNASAKKGRKFLSELFLRRNDIVHQNDRDHESANRKEISKSYVQDNLVIVKKIGQEIYNIAERK